MISYQPQRFSRHHSRSLTVRALALALACASAGTMAAAPALAKDKAPAAGQAKITLSPKFQPVYVDMVKRIDADKARPDVVAAQTKFKAATDRASQKTAQTELAALIATDRAQLDTVMTAAVTPDDNLAAAQLQLQLGSLMFDTKLQGQALKGMIASGKSNPADTGKFQFYIGNFAYEDGDYPAAITGLEAAIAAGYHDNQADVVLADAYLKNKQLDKGLPALQHAIDLQKASGQPVPLSWYRSGVVAAYNAKLVDPTLSFGAGLIEQDPSKQNWALLLQVVRAVAHYPLQDELDLMRLMGRTKSYSEKQDYLEYIQSADARRLPGEVLEVIAAGQAAGMLSASDQTVAEAKSIANGRVAQDRASLPALERDARSPSANAASASAAGDAFLSYGRAADAVAMYRIALDKSGVDTPRVLTRLGIAQIDTGDFAGAQASFAKITGPRQPLGRLWSIYATEKAAGK